MTGFHRLAIYNPPCIFVEDSKKMAVVYRFRITFEDHDEVFRDIEIKSNQTFQDLHVCIQSSIGFDCKKPSSFFMSNDNWIKGQEISTEPRTGKDGKPTALTPDSRLCDFVADPHQKIYYISDYEASWTFFIELMKIVPQASPKTDYPVCVKLHGDAPKQVQPSIAPKAVVAEDDEFAKLMSAITGETALEEPVDEGDEPADEMMIETEEGVDEEELTGMGEEGEEEEMAEGEEESGYESADEDQREDY